MTGYRLYSVDGAGKITAAGSLHAQDDEEAVNIARALNKAANCEIWNGTRFVEAISISEEQTPANLSAL